jgi:hypothetical protein
MASHLNGRCGRDWILGHLSSTDPITQTAAECSRTALAFCHIFHLVSMRMDASKIIIGVVARADVFYVRSSMLLAECGLYCLRFEDGFPASKFERTSFERARLVVVSRSFFGP